MAARSLIESEGLTTQVLTLHATDASVETIQQVLRQAGVERSIPAIYQHINAKLQEPRWKQVYDIAVQVRQRKMREFVIKTVTETADKMQKLFESNIDYYVNLMETEQLTEKQSKALALLSQTFKTWMDDVKKLAEMPEFKSSPSVQVNTQINNLDSSLSRVLRLLQDFSRWLPDDKREQFYQELDAINKPTEKQSSDVIDVTPRAPDTTEDL